MGRAGREEIPGLLDLHQEIIAAYAARIPRATREDAV